MKRDMDDVKENIWMIEFLTVEAMIKRPIHYKELFRECNVSPIEPIEEMSFQ
jgi:hypothetical protein